MSQSYKSTSKAGPLSRTGRLEALKREVRAAVSVKDLREAMERLIDEMSRR